MSDEEDYMSLKFLETAEEFESKRQESTYSERRKRQIREQEKKGYIKPRKVMEEEEREKGLKRSLDEKNKGMKMLMKMGFKKGSGLGKNQNEGIAEPIQVDLKANRFGIGMESTLKKRSAQEEEEMRENKRKTTVEPEDYRAMVAQRVKEDKLCRYLAAAVSICEKLDKEKEVESNIMWVLKPFPKLDDEDEIKAYEQEMLEKESAYPEDEVKEMKELRIEDQLQKVVNYLRSQYFYCFWCRAKYEDNEELDTICPGPEEDEH